MPDSRQRPGPLATLTAVILAGGLGTRLRPAVADRPKALAEIGGRPFLAYLLDALNAAGVRQAVLCTGYRGEMIEQTFGGRHASLQLSYSREEQLLGTGGALRAALPRIASETLLALNGDSFCQADLRTFVQTHFQRQAALSMLLVQQPETARYGRVELEPSGEVREFMEKGDRRGPGLINAGVYLIERRVIEAIPAGQPVSLEREIFPSWIGRGLYGHPVTGRFLDIGTPASYAEATVFFAPSP